MKTVKRFWIIWMVAAIAALPVGVVAAAGQVGPGLAIHQDGAGEVTYATPVQGTIDAAAYQPQSWTFTTQGADRLMARVERLDGNLIPNVSLLDSDGNEVAQSYGADYTYAAAEITNTTLPQAGTYTFVVSRYQDADGGTGGAYQLTVTPLGVGEDNPANTIPVGPIGLDETVNGEITAQHWSQVYTFEAQAGDYIGATSQRTSGTLIVQLSLLDNNGQELRTGYPDNVGVTTVLSGFEASYTGQYSLAIVRDRGINGVTAGQYALTLQLLGSGEESDRLTGAQPGVIDQYNTTQTGEITNANWYQDWQFRTVSADTFTITVQRSPTYSPDTPNTLIPDVVLLDALGNEVRRGYPNDDSASASIDRYTLSEAGMYIVRIERDGGKDGVTSGGYEVTVTLDGVGPDSPSLTDPSGEVTLDTPVQGEITNVRWADSWTFNGQADQRIDILVERTDGTLAPRIELRDSNGQSLRTVYPDNTEDRALLQSYQLGYTGAYTIVVFRENEDTGYTTGSYQMTVSLTQQ